MERNVGKWDSYLRAAISVLLYVLNITKVFSGTLAVITLILAVIIGFTAYVRVCPIYSAFHIRSLKS